MRSIASAINQCFASEFPLSRFVPALGTWIASWIRAAIDHYAAASMYEELSGLSDAGLRRRGLSRDTLAYDVGEAFSAEESSNWSTRRL